jgi:hypothetical protein
MTMQVVYQQVFAGLVTSPTFGLDFTLSYLGLM